METAAADAAVDEPARARKIGFWSCWALTVGTMIGSGVFMLPAVLAPYGLMGFGGWLLTAGGSIAIALALGRLAGRTKRPGGPLEFTRDAFGDLVGFLNGWVFWAGMWMSSAAIAIGFVGYLTVLVPGLSGAPVLQVLVALSLIWGLALISMRGARDAGMTQLVMTILKLAPLAIVVLLAMFTGDAENLPEVNPGNGDPLAVLSVTALLTMFAFLGVESATVPAGDVHNPEKTIPRATVVGTITVAAVYIASTAAVMFLVPGDVLATSTSPFADAARGLGAWGPTIITLGALVSTAGALNGTLFVSGQLPMAAALDGMAPAVLARLNRKGAPWVSLTIGATLASLLLVMNYSRGLVGAFTFLLMMTTATALGNYLFCALAEIKASWRSARSWAVVALVAAVYSLFAIYGSGLEVILWGLVLTAVGAPLYYLGRQRAKVAAAPA